MRIHIHGQADRFNGWGLHTSQAVRYFQKKATVTFTHQSKDTLAGEDSLPYGSMEGADAVLQILPVDNPVIEGSIVWTMHEASHIPSQCAQELNKAKAVLVPNVWNARGFRESGVTCPIYIARLGYDYLVFRFSPKTSGTLTFGTGGSMSGAGERKEVQKVVDAFHSTRLNAKLMVKIFPWDVVNTHGDYRIHVTREVWPETDRLNGWYRSLDCFVTASRGEGFGLMPLQSLICGLDVIAPIYGGHSVYMTPDIVHPLPYTIGPARGTYGVGEQCFVEMSDIAEAMNLVAQKHRVESKEEKLIRTMDQSMAVSHLTWSSAMHEVWSLMREMSCS